MRHLNLFILLFCIGQTINAQQNHTTVFEPETQEAESDGLSSALEKALGLVTFKKGRFNMVIYPHGGYSERAGFGFGVVPVISIADDEEHNKGFNRPTTIIPMLEFTTKGQVYADVTMEVFSWDNWYLNMNTSYIDMPNHYYGINATLPADTSSYFNQRFLANLELNREINNTIFLGFKMDLQHNKINEVEGSALHADIPGYNGGFSFGIGPVFKYDTRDDIVYPTRGGLFQTSWITYAEALGNELSFWHFLAEYSHFVSVVNEKNILGFRGQLQYKEGDVPFYYMSQLGGKRSLRGISQPNRYMDKSMYLFQAEYRRDLWWRLGMVVFAGVGNVFGTDNLELESKLKYSTGMGLRFQMSEEVKLNLRFDVGLGSGGGHGVWISSREAF